MYQVLKKIKKRDSDTDNSYYLIIHSNKSIVMINFLLTPYCYNIITHDVFGSYSSFYEKNKGELFKELFLNEKEAKLVIIDLIKKGIDSKNPEIYLEQVKDDISEIKILEYKRFKIKKKVKYKMTIVNNNKL